MDVLNSDGCLGEKLKLWMSTIMYGIPVLLPHHHHHHHYCRHDDKCCHDDKCRHHDDKCDVLLGVRGRTYSCCSRHLGWKPCRREYFVAIISIILMILVIILMKLESCENFYSDENSLTYFFVDVKSREIEIAPFYETGRNVNHKFPLGFLLEGEYVFTFKQSSLRRSWKWHKLKKSTLFYLLDPFGALAPSGHARTSSWNLWNLWYFLMYCAVLSGVQWACLPFVAACFVLLTVFLAWLAWVGGLVGLGNLCRPCFCTMYSYHVLPAGLSQSRKRLHKP